MTKVKIREFKDFAEGHKGEQNLPPQNRPFWHRIMLN